MMQTQNNNSIARTAKDRLRRLSQKAGASLAAWLNRRTAAVSATGWKYLLAGFCCIALIAFIYVTVNAVRAPGAMTTVAAIRIQARSKVPSVQSGIPAELKAVRRSLDSLQRTADGRKLIDSLISRHPGLLDSLAELERNYETTIDSP